MIQMNQELTSLFNTHNFVKCFVSWAYGSGGTLADIVVDVASLWAVVKADVTTSLFISFGTTSKGVGISGATSFLPIEGDCVKRQLCT